MTERRLPILRPLSLVALLVAASVLMGWLLASGRHGFLFPVVVLIAVLAYKLANVYSTIVKNLEFVFSAVRSNDFSFRFVENPLRTKNAVVNYSLNRIKEVLDDAKTKAADKEKFFEALIECANIGILILLENGTVKQYNGMAMNLLGVPMLSHVERLRQISPDLADTLLAIAPLEQKSVRVATESGDVNLLLNCSSMKYGGHIMRVISIENINRELDTQEGLAWEKLTRILTHEIMNSLAPVTSISSTLLHNMDNAEVIQQGLETIHSTSDRLMQFVDSFRSVTRIPPPRKAPFYLLELLNEARALIKDGNVQMSIAVEPADTMIYADKGQILQVIVNLVKNAVEACVQSGSGQWVELRSHIAPDERVHIEVSNSGGAIPADVAANIFTPFFTTKQDGSGIGLAVSKQIIRLHGGSLSLSQNSDERVTFLVVLD